MMALHLRFVHLSHVQSDVIERSKTKLKWTGMVQFLMGELQGESQLPTPLDGAYCNASLTCAHSSKTKPCQFNYLDTSLYTRL